MIDNGFSTVTLEQYLETVNKHCSAEERKEIHRKLGQYILEGTFDD